MIDIVFTILKESWLVLGQMAPYLLFGFLVAGLLSVGMSPAWVERRLGRRGVGPVVTASLVGVPLPLCSCGVIPVAASIRRHGASRGATTAFLLSTPQTGVDSIAVTYALLGPVFAVFRPLVALVTGIVGGFAVQLLDRPEGKKRKPAEAGPAPTSCCCHGASADDVGDVGDATSQHAAPEVEAGSCCSTAKPKAETESCCSADRDDSGPDEAESGAAGACTEPCCAGAGRENVVVRALRYGFVTLPRDIGPALAVGILVAGAIGALVDENVLRAYVGGGVVSMLLAMAVGIPIYVCATASVPIAVGLIHLGASPGAALAFLIAGPATNAATLTTAWRVLGRRATIVYLATVAASAVLFGLFLDWLLPVGAAAASLGGHAHGEASGHWLSDIGAVAMLAVLVFSYASGRKKRKTSEGKS